MSAARARRLSVTLVSLLFLASVADGGDASVHDETLSLSRYVYIGPIGSQRVVWLYVEPADDGAGADGALRRALFGRVSGSYPDLSTPDDEYLSLQGEVGTDGRFVLEETRQSFSSPSRGPAVRSGQLEGRFTLGFSAAEGEWVSADGGSRRPFRLRRVARYEQRELAYTTEDDCAGEADECVRHLAGTERCRYNTGYLSRYPVWEGADYASLNRVLSRGFWEASEPPLDRAPFDPDAPYLESTYGEINVLSVFSDVVSYGVSTALHSCGEAHPGYEHGLGSLARDAGGRFEALPLEAVVATDPRCRTALREGLAATGEIEAEALDHYDGFALVPTGVRFLYNLSHASGGQTVFVPYTAMPIGCVLPRVRGQGAE